MQSLLDAIKRIEGLKGKALSKSEQFVFSDYFGELAGVEIVVLMTAIDETAMREETKTIRMFEILRTFKRLQADRKQLSKGFKPAQVKAPGERIVLICQKVSEHYKQLTGATREFTPGRPIFFREMGFPVPKIRTIESFDRSPEMPKGSVSHDGHPLDRESFGQALDFGFGRVG